MKREKAIDMIKDIISRADYDLGKQYSEATAEDPDSVEGYIQELLTIVEMYIDIEE